VRVTSSGSSSAFATTEFGCPAGRAAVLLRPVTYQFGNSARTRRRARPIAQTLLRVARETTVKGLDVPIENVAAAGIVVGWWQHVNNLASDFLVLTEHGGTIPATPVERRRG